MILPIRIHIWLQKIQTCEETFLQSPKHGIFTAADWTNEKRVCKDFEIKSLVEYHDWYLQSNTLLLAGVFDKLQNIYLEIYKLDPEKFLTAPGLVWEGALKKAKVKLDLLIDIDMLLMVENGIRGGICHAIHQFVKTNNKYMKDYDKIKE